MPQKKKRSDLHNRKESWLISTDKTDTETEGDIQLTKEQLKESMKWKIGEPKEVIKKKKKTGRETRMRVWTGAWFFSFYVTSFLISTVTMLLASQWLMFQVMKEILRVGRDTKKDR